MVKPLDTIVQLRQGTQVQHSAIEKSVVFSRLLKPEISTLEYHLAIQSLGELHSMIVHNTKPNVKHHPSLAKWFSHIDDNLTALHQDIKAIGRSNQLTPLPCQSGPSFETTAQGYGALYVVMGSALGAKLIHPALLNSRLPKTLPHHYFTRLAHSSNWLEFIKQLNQQNLKKTQTQQAIDAANATFSFLAQIANSSSACLATERSNLPDRQNHNIL